MISSWEIPTKVKTWRVKWKIDFWEKFASDKKAARRWFLYTFLQCKSINLSTSLLANSTVGRALNNAVKALCLQELNDVRWYWLHGPMELEQPLVKRCITSELRAVIYPEGGGDDEWWLPCGSAFLKAFPASMKLVAASCLLCICRWRRAAWENAFPAAENKMLHVKEDWVTDKEEGYRYACSSNIW